MNLFYRYGPPHVTAKHRNIVNALKLAKRQGADPQELFNMRETLIDQLVNECEGERQEALSKLTVEKDAFEKELHRKLYDSKEGKAQADILARRYKSMSDKEINALSGEYTGGKRTFDVWELDALNDAIRERGLNHDQFRMAVKVRGDHDPARKLNPLLYRELDELEAVPFGHVRAVVEGKNGQHVSQIYKIREQKGEDESEEW